ncbi:MAG: ABC transporter ATP-binding protein [Proteobacteria bacterium]|nr:ABC transporter ATP-binding protein [Pseudomonadota bacterium]
MHDALHARGVCVERGGRRIVRGVDVDAAGGRVTAILGPNGAGKTTLLKALLGLVPSTGTIRIFGWTLGDLSARQRAQRLAYVPQQTQLSATLAVRDVVAQGRFAHRSSLARLDAGDRRRVSAAMRTAGVEAWAERTFPSLSGGEQRLVLIARAVCTGARILLLDEPTSSLDVAHRLHILDLLRRLASDGRAVVCVLHEIDDARQHTDDAVVLAGGSTVAHGPAAATLSADLVDRVWGVDMIEAGGIGFRLRQGVTS